MTFDEFMDVRNHGFQRVAVVVPMVRVADPQENLRNHLEQLKAVFDKGANYAVAPELGLTGYTCGDLFHSRALQDAACEALQGLLDATADWEMIISVGMPVSVDQAVFNAAVTIFRGSILSVTPKTYLPEYREFYEMRYFAQASEAKCESISLCGQDVPFGTDILIHGSHPDAIIYPTICEDDWTPVPPSSRAALAGATILANLSASNIVIGKAAYRESLIVGSSARNQAAHLYAAAGFGESTTDLAWDGHAFIADRGYLITSTERFHMGGAHAVADIDLEALVYERGHQSSFRQNASDYHTSWRHVTCPESQDHCPRASDIYQVVQRHITAHPFVPDETAARDERCKEVFMIQSTSLAQRLMSLPENMRKLVVAVSGGQDSTHALNVAVHTMDLLKLPRSNVHAITMPGFGTTDRTYDNACQLIRATGATFQEIDIKPVTRQIFSDIDHSEDKHNIVYENTQAWLRKIEELTTAAKIDGIVLGTGDLSELVLGWCTMFGDHASHYAINASIPKTLISYLIGWTADELFKDEPDVGHVLRDILDTPISPELLPPKDGEIVQKTEEKVGPYELHDFFTYYFIRFGFSPKRIARLCFQAFDGKYDLPTIKTWMREYLTRFFRTQLKRSCLPDGPKVGMTSISPRGDWRMPSDASVSAWLADLDRIP
jgi:NAD+ synthase (glutamine-hydrolysing)